MLEILFFILLGLVAAVFGSIVGLGGGIIIVPALMILGPYLTGKPIDHTTAVGTSLTVLTNCKTECSSLFSGYLFY